MRRTRLAVVMAAVLVGSVVSPFLTVAALSGSYHDTASELSNATTKTNLAISGGKLSFTLPQQAVDNSSEFSNGSLTNTTVGTDAVVYDGGQVISQYTSDTEFSNANELTSAAVAGTGAAASVDYSATGANVSTSFEDQTADAGTPNNWEWYNTAETSNVTTLRANDGSQSAFIEYTQSGGSGLNPAVQPYGKGQTYRIEWDHHASSGKFILRAWENGSALFQFGVRQGDLYYFNSTDGAWRKLSTAVDRDEWLDFSLTEWNPSNQTVRATWSEPDGETDSTILQVPGMSGGYTAVYFGTSGGSGFIDDVQIGQTTNTPGTYVSQNHSVSNDAGAAVNITTLDNMTAQISATEQPSGTELASTSVSSPGNHTLSWASSSGTVRTNVTFVPDGSNPAGSLADEGIVRLADGSYTSPSRSPPDVSTVKEDLTLPDTTDATVTVQGRNTGGSWTDLTTTTYTSGGTKTVSVSSSYDDYRTVTDFSRSSYGSDGRIDNIEFVGTTSGEYVGTAHSVEDANAMFLAFNASNVSVDATAQGKDGGSWTDLQTTTYNSSTFGTEEFNGAGYSTYRVKLSVADDGVNPVFNLSAEGITPLGAVQSAGKSPSLVEAAGATTRSTGLVDSTLSGAWSQLGAVQRYVGSSAVFSLLQDDGDRNVQLEARRATAAYNARNDTYTDYLSGLVNDTELVYGDYDVVRINMTVDGETATRYWLANTSDSGYTKTQIANGTTRTVDETLDLEGYAALQLDNEIRSLHEDYAAPDEPPTPALAARLAAEYGPDADGSLINATG